jgi:hypothetical protein
MESYSISRSMPSKLLRALFKIEEKSGGHYDLINSDLKKTLGSLSSTLMEKCTLNLSNKAQPKLLVSLIVSASYFRSWFISTDKLMLCSRLFITSLIP